MGAYTITFITVCVVACHALSLLSSVVYMMMHSRNKETYLKKTFNDEQHLIKTVMRVTQHVFIVYLSVKDRFL